MIKNSTEFYEFEGARLAYDFTPAQAECRDLLVLINGYQRNRLDFRAFRNRFEKLSPQTATLAFDNRYCGETIVISENPLTLEQMARDAKALETECCQKWGLKAYSVLGISMGGMIAQILAVQDTRVHKLFLVSTTAGGKARIWPTQAPHPEKSKYKNSFETLESTQKHMRRYFGEKFLKASPLLFEMICKNLVKESQKNKNFNQNGAEHQFYASIGYDGTGILSEIGAKTTVFSGYEDQIIPVANSFFLKENISQSTLQIYEGIGHLILIEEPQKFAQDIAMLCHAE